MIKYLLNFLFVFLMLSSFSFAKDDDSKLQKEFGPDLSHAPFFLRFAFSKEFNKDWGKSDYSERKAFLTDYETNLTTKQKQEAVDAKTAATEEKERLRAQKAELRQEKEKLKTQEAEEKAEKAAREEFIKETTEAEKEQHKELAEMERQATQGNH